MIKIFYEDRTTIPQEEQYRQDLYSSYISLNESYYDYKLSLVEQDAYNDIEKQALEWFNLNKVPFDKHVDSYNLFIGRELQTMIDDIDNGKLNVFYNGNQNIKDIKSNFKPLPQNISDRLNKLEYLTKSAISSIQYKKFTNPMFYYGELPQWFYSNETNQDMAKYLNDSAKISIYEGDYHIKLLLKMILKDINALEHYKTSAETSINKERRRLDILRDKYLSQIEDPFILKAFNEALEIVYRQIYIYQSAMMRLYGKYIIELGNTVRNLYNDYLVYKENINSIN